MKAVTFQGIKDIQVKQVEDPALQQHDDIIVRITSTAICGSDLHIYQGALPAAKDYVIGHEPMGIVEEVGPEVTRVKKGDRVVLPFNIACGQCFYCNHDMESQCDKSNGNPDIHTGGTSGSPSDMVVIRAVRLNCYECLTATSLHLSFPNPVSWKTRHYCSFPTCCRRHTGVLKMLASSLGIPSLYSAVALLG